jgi:hypothetical protein
MSDDKSLEDVLAPQDVAELSAAGDAILDHPPPSAAGMERLEALRQSSPDRIEAMLEAGEIDFDFDTQQGHVDAVTYLTSVLLGGCKKVGESDDPIVRNEAFTAMHDVWSRMSERIQFNVVVDLAINYLAAIDKDDK